MNLKSLPSLVGMVFTDEHKRHVEIVSDNGVSVTFSFVKPLVRNNKPTGRDLRSANRDFVIKNFKIVSRDGLAKLLLEAGNYGYALAEGLDIKQVDRVSATHAYLAASVAVADSEALDLF